MKGLVPNVGYYFVKRTVGPSREEPRQSSIRQLNST